MPIDTEVKQLIINVLTEEQYKTATINENELYLTPDTGSSSTPVVQPHEYLTISNNQILTLEQYQALENGNATLMAGGNVLHLTTKNATHLVFECIDSVLTSTFKATIEITTRKITLAQNVNKKVTYGSINGNSVVAPNSFNLTLPTSSDFQAQANKIAQMEATHEAINTQLNNKINSSEKGVANGVATLDKNTKIPSSQLPSYVDDVLEFASRSAFPQTGESGKIYLDLATNKTYRWGGSTYVVIGSDLALGETASTAYYGDKGAKNASDIANLQANKQDKMYVGVITESGAQAYTKLNSLITNDKPIISFTHNGYIDRDNLLTGDMIAFKQGDVVVIVQRGVSTKLFINGNVLPVTNFALDFKYFMDSTGNGFLPTGLKMLELMAMGYIPHHFVFDGKPASLIDFSSLVQYTILVKNLEGNSNAIIPVDKKTGQFQLPFFVTPLDVTNASSLEWTDWGKDIIYDDTNVFPVTTMLPCGSYKNGSLPYVENGIYKQYIINRETNMSGPLSDYQTIKQYFGGIVDLTGKANCTQEEYDKLANGNYVVKKDGIIFSLTNASASQLIFESKKTKLTIDATNKTIVSSIIQQASETYTKFNATLDGGKSTNISLLEMKQAEFVINIATADTATAKTINFKLGTTNIYTATLRQMETSALYLKLSFFGNEAVVEYGARGSGKTITTTKDFLTNIQPILTIEYNDDLSGGATINGWGAK